MSITTQHAATTTRTSAETAKRPVLWRPTVAAGFVAAAATSVVAATAHAVGISLEVDGEPIPVLGFANLTLMCVALGFVLAVSVRRWAQRPRRTFVASAVALTVASFVPDLIVDATVATRLTLMTTHVVAAIIVIPVIAKRLSTERW
jgi:hypothetical protein